MNVDNAGTVSVNIQSTTRTLKMLTMLLTLAILSTLLNGCNSEQSEAELAEPPSVDTATITPLFNRQGWQNETVAARQVLSAQATNASGNFNHPFTNEVFVGNLLVAIDVADPDGIAAVALSFNESANLYYLCNNAADCNGTSFQSTATNISPSNFGVYFGPVTLGLWVKDTLGNQVQVNAVTLNWQFRRLDNLNITRDQNSITADWQPQPELARYNLYLAQQPGVNKDNYLALTAGQAKLAVTTPPQQFLNLPATDTYYLLITGVDGSGESAFSTEIRLDPPLPQTNTLPDAQNDLIIDDEDNAVAGNLLANDVDADDNTLTVNPIPLRPPFFGDITLLANGDFIYRPQANFNGQDSFDYEIQDGQGGFARATANLTINPVNDPPQALADNYNGTANQALSVAAPGLLANDTDIDGDALTVNTTAVIAPSQGVVTLVADGSFTYQPNADAQGNDSFTYQIIDAEGVTSDAQVTILFDEQNAPPIAVNDTYVTDLNITLIVDGGEHPSVLANDSDPEGGILTLTDTLIDNVDNGTLTISNDGFFTYIPNANFIGIDTFTYQISDPDGATAQATVTIHVLTDNQPPIANDDTATLDEDSQITIDVLANDSDPDGDPLEIIDWRADNGTVDATTADLTYTPNANFNGTDTITYTIYDFNAHTDTAIVTVTVNPVNDAPVAIDDSADMVINTTLVIDVLANDTDIDNDTLTVTNATASQGTVTINTDNTLLLDNITTPGLVLVNYDISDGNGGTDSAVVSVNAFNQNQPPVAVNDTYTTNQNTPLIVDGITHPKLTANDSDPDIDPITVTTTPLTNVTNGMLVLQADGSFTYTPNTEFTGIDTFRYQISDSFSNTAEADVTIDVKALNFAPQARPDNYQLRPNTTLTIDGISGTLPLANDTDPNNDPLSYRGAITTPQSGTLSDNSDSSFTYSPNANFSGVDNFLYEIEDPNGAKGRAIVSLNVAEISWAGDLALPNIPPIDLRAITYDGQDFFAAGDGNILTSTAGVLWSNAYNDTGSSIISMASGNSLLTPTARTTVALGNANSVFIQQAEQSQGYWVERTINFQLPLTSINFSRGEFYATGQQIVAFSLDGIDWGVTIPNSLTQFNSIQEQDGLLVVVGNDGIIEISDDRLNWKITGSNLGANLNDITYGNNTYTVVGDNGVIFTSTDANSWAERTSNVATNLNTIAFGNGIFIAGGDENTVLTSIDGATWQQQQNIDTAGILDIVYNGIKFVLTGYNGAVFSTTDGVTFAPVVTGDHSSFTGIATDGNTIISSSTAGDFYVSNDEQTWFRANTGQANAINNVKYYNNQFIAVGDGGLVLTSTTGTAWTTQNTPTTKNIRDIFWFNGLDMQGSPFSLYVAVGDSGLLMTSTDAARWTVETEDLGTISNESFYGVSHDDDYFVAVGQNGRILVRNNMATPGETTWMDFFSNTSFGQLNGIFYNGQTNIIVGNNGTIITGTALGGNFTRLATSFNDNLNAVAVSGNNYIIVGDNGVTFTSIDGTNWLPARAGTSMQLNSVTYNGNVFYAVGDQGAFVKGIENY